LDVNNQLPSLKHHWQYEAELRGIYLGRYNSAMKRTQSIRREIKEEFVF